MIKLPKKTYSLKSIRDTIYWLSKDYSILLDEEEHHFQIHCDNEPEYFRQNFLMKLNDFELRNEINIQTAEIKSLVTAKAFYPDLVNFKEIGEFEDPVLIEKRHAESNH
jgi:His-Xaa-Ser system protein HxsD